MITFRTSMILALAIAAHAARILPAADEPATIDSARNVLREIMSIPGKQIPQAMLADARGVVIVPGVIKIGFIAGVRHGRGVVLTRDAEGAWGLPQFITLTGGSVGWQAGAQSTDVVLVFKTQKSVDGLLRGKFTIGADAEAAAGPVGRRIEAATDAQLKAEIYAYSRSRGLFAGVALDGTALQIDNGAYANYYGSPPSQPPLQVPENALALVSFVGTLTATPERAVEQVPGELVPVVRPREAVPASDLQRNELAQKARQLYPILTEEWRRYLALPAEVFSVTHAPSVEALGSTLRRFDAVDQNGRYRTLSERQEFRGAYEALQRYVALLSAESAPRLNLPPPPVQDQR